MLANIQSDQVRFFISQKNISAKLRQALKELVDMQEALHAVRQERQQKEQRMANTQGTKIVLTASATEMSEFGNSQFFAFVGAFASGPFPKWLLRKISLISKDN
jgi:hypothetical protein